jgi:hypothetical protein
MVKQYNITIIIYIYDDLLCVILCNEIGCEILQAHNVDGILTQSVHCSMCIILSVCDLHSLVCDANLEPVSLSRLTSIALLGIRGVRVTSARRG